MIYYRKTLFGIGPKLTAVQTYNIPTKTLLYSSHIQQYDLDGGTAGTVFVANCRTGTN